MCLLYRFRQIVLKVIIVVSISTLLLWDTKPRAYAFTSVVNSESLVASAETVWENIAHELTLDRRVDDPRVQKEIKRLLADKDDFNKALKAATNYIFYIHQQTKAYQLPVEIALIPFIESQFNPNDRSNVGATGLWQLMPKTAKDLGVKVKTNYDGRKNVTASTQAAMAYFKDLGKLFRNNWYLAIAAYNCGEGRVLSAIKRAGSRFFFDLKLPLETKLYLPRLLAVAEIIKNPTKYGIKLPSVSNEPYFAELQVSKPVNLTRLAETVGIEFATLDALNPDYKKGHADLSSTDRLLVPADKISDVQHEIPGAVLI